MNSKMFSIFLLAVSTGLPISLGVETFKIWMWEEGASLEFVTLLNITTFPYVAKVLFGPMVDQYKLPILHTWLGRRKSWAVLSQMFILLGFLFIGAFFTARNFMGAFVVLTLIAVFSAINNAALNAYRVEIINPGLYSIAAVVGTLGYRLGKLLAGAGALIVAAIIGWNLTYILVPLVLVITIISTILAEEPKAHEDDIVVSESKLFKDKLLKPFQAFIKRNSKEWKVIVFFILLYGIGDYLIEGVLTIFYLDVGFSKIEVANVAKALGLIFTIIGGLLGGHLVLRMGIHKMVYLTTILHCLSYLMLVVLSYVGDNILWLYLSVLTEFITEGMKTAALVAFISALCGKTYYTASQYALFSSIKVILRPFFGTWAGTFVKYLGWSNFFIFAMLLSLLPLVFYVQISPNVLKSHE